MPTVNPSFVQQIQIRLRSTITPNSSTGYEVIGGTPIVRWNGAPGNYTVLPGEGLYATLHDGDIFEAQMVGNVITVYVNGVKVNRAVDNTFTNGSPGIGFFTRNASPLPFELSSSAWDTSRASRVSPARRPSSTATAGNAQATVSFTAATNGGSPTPRTR